MDGVSSLPMIPVKQDPGTDRKLAEELYDFFMATVEPDLMLKNIPTLETTYAKETKEQHEARMKKYQTAYKKFDEKFGEFKFKINRKVHEARKASLNEAETKAKGDDSAVIAKMEEEFR